MSKKRKVLTVPNSYRELFELYKLTKEQEKGFRELYSDFKAFDAGNQREFHTSLVESVHEHYSRLKLAFKELHLKEYKVSHNWVELLDQSPVINNALSKLLLPMEIQDGEEWSNTGTGYLENLRNKYINEDQISIINSILFLLGTLEPGIRLCILDANNEAITDDEAMRIMFQVNYDAVYVVCVQNALDTTYLDNELIKNGFAHLHNTKYLTSVNGTKTYIASQLNPSRQKDLKFINILGRWGTIQNVNSEKVLLPDTKASSAHEIITGNFGPGFNKDVWLKAGFDQTYDLNEMRKQLEVPNLKQRILVKAELFDVYDVQHPEKQDLDNGMFWIMQDFYFQLGQPKSPFVEDHDSDVQIDDVDELANAAIENADKSIKQDDPAGSTIEFAADALNQIGDQALVIPEQKRTGFFGGFVSYVGNAINSTYNTLTGSTNPPVTPPTIVSVTPPVKKVPKAIGYIAPPASAPPGVAAPQTKTHVQPLPLQSQIVTVATNHTQQDKKAPTIITSSLETNTSSNAESPAIPTTSATVSGPEPVVATIHPSVITASKTKTKEPNTTTSATIADNIKSSSPTGTNSGKSGTVTAVSPVAAIATSPTPKIIEKLPTVVDDIKKEEKLTTLTPTPPTNNDDTKRRSPVPLVSSEETTVPPAIAPVVAAAESITAKVVEDLKHTLEHNAAVAKKEAKVVAEVARRVKTELEINEEERDAKIAYLIKAEEKQKELETEMQKLLDDLIVLNPEASQHTLNKKKIGSTSRKSSVKGSRKTSTRRGSVKTTRRGGSRKGSKREEISVVKKPKKRSVVSNKKKSSTKGKVVCSETTVVELKAKLGKLGLSKSGNKATLCRRLRQQQ